MGLFWKMVIESQMAFIWTSTMHLKSQLLLRRVMGYGLSLNTGREGPYSPIIRHEQYFWGWYWHWLFEGIDVDYWHWIGRFGIIDIFSGIETRQLSKCNSWHWGKWRDLYWDCFSTALCLFNLRFQLWLFSRRLDIDWTRENSLVRILSSLRKKATIENAWWINVRL